MCCTCRCMCRSTVSNTGLHFTFSLLPRACFASLWACRRGARFTIEHVFFGLKAAGDAMSFHYSLYICKTTKQRSQVCSLTSISLQVEASHVHENTMVWCYINTGTLLEDAARMIKVKGLLVARRSSRATWEKSTTSQVHTHKHDGHRMEKSSMMLSVVLSILSPRSSPRSSKRLEAAA